MTSRERLIAAARGGPTDRRCVVLFPSTARSDARIVPWGEVGAALAEDTGQAVLAEVLSPLGRALVDGCGLNDAIRDDPAAGQIALDAYVADTRLAIHAAMAAGADGVFYRLQGAVPAISTPMQYGGLYLERDRELLAEIEDARLNILSVEGGPEPYLDFVADLPAHVLAWDSRASGIGADAVRAMRRGALAACDAHAEILFADRWEPLSPLAELETTHV